MKSTYVFVLAKIVFFPILYVYDPAMVITLPNHVNVRPEAVHARIIPTFRIRRASWRAVTQFARCNCIGTVSLGP